MTTEDLSGTTWLGPRGGTRKVISRDDAYLGNVWMVRIEGYSVLVPYRAEDIRSWTRVDEKAEPTEDEDKSYPVGAVRHVEHPSETVVAAKARAKEAVDAAKNARTPALSAPILPSDVHDGDLLSGTLFGNPFTDWPVRRAEDRGYVYVGDWQGDHVGLSGAVGDSGWRWGANVTVTARKPAPRPPLPWVEHPDAWWAVDSTDGWTSVLPSAAMTSSDPTGWTRVNAPTPFRGYVPISRKLIEDLRPFVAAIEDARLNWGSRDYYLAAKAILDAADES